MPAWSWAVLVVAGCAVPIVWLFRRAGASVPNEDESTGHRRPARLVTEGSELPGAINVIEVRRDALTRTVYLVTDAPARPLAVYQWDDLIDVVRLGP